MFQQQTGHFSFKPGLKGHRSESPWKQGAVSDMQYTVDCGAVDITEESTVMKLTLP